MTVEVADGFEMDPCPSTTVPPVGPATAVVNAPTLNDAANVAAAGAVERVRARGALPARRSVLQGGSVVRVCMSKSLSAASHAVRRDSPCSKSHSEAEIE